MSLLSIEIPGVTVYVDVEQSGEPFVFITATKDKKKGSGAALNVTATGMDVDQLAGLLSTVATSIKERDEE